MESDEFDIEGIQEENIEEQEIEVERSQRPLHQTKRGRKKISYKRPNRNYAKQTRWTFEMNKDVYECYLQAERDKPGYMKRLKALWDEIRPEYSHLSDKNLRDRVDRIIKKNLLADYITGQRKLANSDNVNEPDISEVLTPTSRFVHERTEGEPLNDEQMIDENEKEQENNTPINTEQDSYMPTNAEAQELFDRIKEKWGNYFQNYKEMDLENREFTTRISRNLSNIQWTITNEIVHKHLKDISEVREVDLWDLNVCYYVSAVTLLDCSGLLNQKEIKRREKPGWLIQYWQILAMTGSLNKKSDIDRLYVKRDQGGRGIISTEDTYCIRMISLHEHLEQVKHQNHYLMKVIEHEKNNIVRLSNEFKEEFNELVSQLVSEGVENIENKIKRCLNMHHLKSWEEKVTHGYLQCQIKKNEQINLKETYGWLKSENFSSHVEGYLFSLQEQEINTRAAQKRWERNLDKRRNIDGRCRLCKQKDEDLFHIISSCSSLSNSMYLYYRHDNVGKIIYEEITADEQGKVTRQCRKPPTVTHCNGKEIWWNVPLNLPNKVEHNLPDIIEWDNVNKTCTIVEISTPLDTNVTDRTKWKKDLYMPLVAEMSRIYKHYKFEIVPIVVGALGAIPNSLLENLRSLSITGKRLKRTSSSLVLI